MLRLRGRSPFFFFNDTATTEIYTLSLHDALPISHGAPAASPSARPAPRAFSAVWRKAEYSRCRTDRSEEHTSELQSLAYLVCRLLLEKKKRSGYSGFDGPEALVSYCDRPVPPSAP